MLWEEIIAESERMGGATIHQTFQEEGIRQVIVGGYYLSIE